MFTSLNIVREVSKFHSTVQMIKSTQSTSITTNKVVGSSACSADRRPKESTGTRR